MRLAGPLQAHNQLRARRLGLPRLSAHASTSVWSSIRPASTSASASIVSRYRCSSRVMNEAMASFTIHPFGRSRRAAKPSSFFARSSGRWAVTTRVSIRESSLIKLICSVSEVTVGRNNADQFRRGESCLMGCNAFATPLLCAVQCGTAELVTVDHLATMRIPIPCASTLAADSGWCTPHLASELSLSTIRVTARRGCSRTKPLRRG